MAAVGSLAESLHERSLHLSMRSYLSFNQSPSTSSHMPHPPSSSPLTPLILPQPPLPQNYRQVSQSMDDTPSLPIAEFISPHTHHSTASAHPTSLSATPSVTSPLQPPPQLTSETRWMDVWPGYHTFLFGGRLVIGSNPLLFLVTLLLQLASLALFLTCVALPAFPLYYTLPLVAVFPPLFASFLAASLSDPGILPPLSKFVPVPPTQVDIDGQTRKWCVYCRLWRARRAKHCKYCHVCVDEFDHHWSPHC